MTKYPCLPSSIREMVHAGTTVFVAVAAMQPDHHASVSVRAIIDMQKGYWEYVNKYIIVRLHPDDDPVIGYEVLHREWHRKYDEDPNYWEGGEVSYQKTYKTYSEAELMHVLHELHVDVTELSTRKPFE